MRSEILISTTRQAFIAAGARASKQRCRAAISTAGVWFDVATKYEHADMNPTPPGGPGGPS